MRRSNKRSNKGDRAGVITVWALTAEPANHLWLAVRYGICAAALANGRSVSVRFRSSAKPASFGSATRLGERLVELTVCH